MKPRESTRQRRVEEPKIHLLIILLFLIKVEEPHE